MRTGILGGSFDPVHKGHLGIAWEIQKNFPLDEMIFIPAAQAPLKDKPALASANDRLAMLRCAIKEYPGRTRISTFELHREGISYSIDTARHLKANLPKASLYWIIGLDQALQLNKWHQIKELAELVNFIVVSRPGYQDFSSPGPFGIHLNFFKTCTYEISSTEIRKKLAGGCPISMLYPLLPKTVAEYIYERHLYQQT